MKAPGRHVLIIACSCALLALTACQKINLSGGGKSGGSTGANANSGGNQATGFFGGGQAQSSLPPVDGEWEFDYEFKGTPYQGNVQLSQSGQVVAGAGTDQDGKQWDVVDGQMQGTKISFQKKYASSSGPPITYTGELKHEASAEYTGWLMEGTYSSTGPGGEQIGGKWIANPLSPLPEPAAASAPAQQPSGNMFQPASSPPPQQAQSSNSDLGDVRPADVSGKYEGTYTYDFKKINTKMWLRNDGKKITGDGVDIVGKTSNRFKITRGWYDYPKVTLVRQYTKGDGATETRSMTFKASITSNGRDIAMKGETQYGGAWNAHLVR